MSVLNLAASIDSTEAEGPGRRFALWVQGCNIRCPGCCNREMFDFVPRVLCSSEQVTARVAEAKRRYGIEGLTFLGGEPMLQARGLADVASSAREMGLSVMVFTGFVMRQLDAMSLPGTAELLRATDILVDGPFVAALPEESRRWAGSTNQRFHYLSNRYPVGMESDGKCPREVEREVEIRIRSNSDLIVNGWPDLFVQQ